MENNIFSGIVVDYDRDKLFSEHGLDRLKESYVASGEKSPQERFAFVSKTFASNPEHAQRLYEYSSKHWLSYATPLLSFGRSKRGMNISCFLTLLNDTAESLVNTLSEVNWLSMLGGGVGVHVKIRNADEKSVGVLPHLKTYDASSLAYRQGKTRRGSYAAYLDISHPDIMMFFEMRKGTGDERLRAKNLHHGVNITDKFMNIIDQCQRNEDFDDSWELINPSNGKVVEVVSAKMLWAKLIETRFQQGEPYVIFIDTANRKLPQWLKDQGLKINGSNLCLEADSIIEVKFDSSFEKIRIEDFVTKYECGLYGDSTVFVKSWDESTKAVIWSKVTAAAQTGTATELIEIISDTGKVVRCTPDHQILTQRGWVMAKELREDDSLVESDF